MGDSNSNSNTLNKKAWDQAMYLLQLHREKRQFINEDWLSMMMMKKNSLEEQLTQIAHILKHQQESCVYRKNRGQDCVVPFFAIILHELIQVNTESTISKCQIKRLYEEIIDYHKYLYRNGDVLQEGLVATSSFGAKFYGFALNLLPSTSEQERSDKPKWPTRYQDPLFNSVLTLANECLIKIGCYLKEDITEMLEFYELTIHSINEKLWRKEDQIYVAFDLAEQTYTSINTVSGLMPLIAEIPTQHNAELMRKRFEKHILEHGCLYRAIYEGTNLWQQHQFKRSGNWAMVNCLLYNGFMKYDFEDLAIELKDKTIKKLDKLFKEPLGGLENQLGISVLPAYWSKNDD